MRGTLLAAGAAAVAAAPALAPPAATVTVALRRPVNTVAPPAALGADLDGQSHGDVAQIYTPRNLALMRSAGFGSVAYRLRTELGVEAWHWAPRGRFSGGDRGYWTTSAASPAAGASYGYRLPRRGNTIDQANDDGYSRLDDGNARTFWKSNPYLDARFAREPHPQWVLVDLGAARPVDAIEIDWAQPYARRVRVAYWTGTLPPARYGAERENALFGRGWPDGRWATFPAGSFAGHRGRQRAALGAAPVTARWLLVTLSGSSHTAPPGSGDVRDRLGFAIRELSVGRRSGGRLLDFVRHARSRVRQSVVWVSSTDPWHTARDVDRDTEQPSFARVFASGLTRGRPLLMAVPLLYGTPADAAAELRYMLRHRYPVRRVELGEEPDGQLASPEDYGALYIQFARALRRVDPRVEIGGPSLSTAVPDWVTWPDRRGETSWTRRFVGYLRARRALGELRFFSFEWYPFDDVCSDPAPNLASAPRLLAALVRRLPRSIPKLITEYGYSAFAAEPEVDLPGALFDAGAAAGFLTLGGRGAYFYGYEPQNLMRESRFCDTVGNLELFRSGDRHRARVPVAAYWAERMLNDDWLGHGRRARIYAASVSGTSAPVSAYAARRGDGRLSLLLINADPSATVAVRFAGLRCRLAGRQLSRATYGWRPGHGPGPDRPPRRVSGATLPPYSLTVLSGRC